MAKPKVHWSKKVKEVPRKLPEDSTIRIRPVSFHMDKIIDKYVVSGGRYGSRRFVAIVSSGKREALKIAHARLRLLNKYHKQSRRR